MGHTPSTAGTFRKRFRKNSGQTPETLSERFLEFPARVRLGCPKPYNSRHLRLPEHFQNYLPPVRLGAFFFQKWFRTGPPRAGHGIPSSTGGISDNNNPVLCFLGFSISLVLSALWNDLDVLSVIWGFCQGSKRLRKRRTSSVPSTTKIFPNYGFKKALLQNPREIIRGQIFSEIIRIQARKSELQAESRRYSPTVGDTAGQTPRIRTESPRNGPEWGLGAFTETPP